jgi:cytoskeletal protein CcmA (bactofilin family)
MMMAGIARKHGNGESGFALVSAMIFLVVLLFIGASLVQTSMQELQVASRVRKETRALNLAEAGVDYAVWQLYNHPTGTLPMTWQRDDLNGGSFSVTASQYVDETGAPVANTVVLQSIGTSQAWPAHVKVVGRFLVTPGVNNPIFDFALFSDAELRMGGTADISGDVHANANVRINGSPTVDGNVSSSGAIRESGSPKITGNQKQFAPKMPMPTIDLAYYRSIAKTVVGGGYSFNGTTDLDGVIYVDGDCSINGSFKGKGMIVCRGLATVNGSATVTSLEEDELAIVSAGGVRVNGTCRIEGYIYTHSMDVPAGFSGNGTADVLGGVIADVITANGTLKVTYKQPTLPLPGDSSTPAQFAAVSWRRVR